MNKLPKLSFGSTVLTLVLVIIVGGIIGCVFNPSWERLMGYLTVIAVTLATIWWYWIHRAKLKEDWPILANWKDISKCRWIGSKILYVAMVIVVILIFLAGMLFIEEALSHFIDNHVY